MSDIVIWQTIGGKRFCCYKKKITENVFCRSVYNISGLCSRQACPLANSRYATILEKRGKLYLYMKTPERAHTPAKLWERIELHPNFLRALAQVNKYLQFWPRFLRQKAKMRLTRLHQYLTRTRRMQGKELTKLVGVHKKSERQARARESKAHSAAHLTDSIRSELLNRLRSGTYGELYDDIVNYDLNKFNEALDEEEDDDDLLDDDMDWLGEPDSTKQFVEAYSDEEEDAEEYEMEYETENQRQRERQRVTTQQNDDDDDDDDDDDEENFIFDDEDFPVDEEDEEEEDIEDHVPDFTTIQKKQQVFAQPTTSKKQLAGGRTAMATKQPAKQQQAKASTGSFAARARQRRSGGGIDDQ